MIPTSQTVSELQVLCSVTPCTRGHPLLTDSVDFTTAVKQMMLGDSVSLCCSPQSPASHSLVSCI